MSEYDYINSIELKVQKNINTEVVSHLKASQAQRDLGNTQNYTGLMMDSDVKKESPKLSKMSLSCDGKLIIIAILAVLLTTVVIVAVLMPLVIMKEECDACDDDIDDAKWMDWNEWGRCSVSCGRGQHERTRIHKDDPDQIQTLVQTCATMICETTSEVPERVNEQDLSPHWKHVPATGLKWIAAGRAGVWASRQHNSYVLLLRDSYNVDDPSLEETFDPVSGLLKQMSVCQDTIFGVNDRNDAFNRSGITPSKQQGEKWGQLGRGVIKFVSVSKDCQQIWGVDPNGKLKYLKNVDTDEEWLEENAGIPKYQTVSAGEKGLWITTPENAVRYRDYGFRGNTHPESWVVVKGEVTQLAAESGKWIVGVTPAQGLVYRTGVTQSNPTGVDWKKIEFSNGKVRQVSVYKNRVWLTTVNSQTWTTSLVNSS